jgi:hypothetical protein
MCVRVLVSMCLRRCDVRGCGIPTFSQVLKPFVKHDILTDANPTYVHTG